MNTHADQTHQNKTQAAATQKQSENSSAPNALIDNRPGAIAQTKLQAGINNSPRLQQFKAYQTITDNRIPAIAQRKKVLEEKENPAQKKTNNTGLPDDLKSGVESLSNISLDGVKVHYNSDKPGQLQAHAYAQGTDIHIAPGQEKHLPHEAWHVAQQAQGRVKQTMQMKAGIPVNDDPHLEHEADVMGEKAIQIAALDDSSLKTKPLQGKFVAAQRKEASTAKSKHHAVLQAVWNKVQSDDDSPTQYTQDVEIEGRTWEVKLSKGKGDNEEAVTEDDSYRYKDKDVLSAWKTAEEWTEEGISPPLGARFQDQRDEAEQTQDDAQDYAFEAATLAPGAPLTIRRAHKLLEELIQHTRLETKQNLDMLDHVVADEFKQIATTSAAIVQVVKSKKINELTEKQQSTLNEFFSTDEINKFKNVAMTADQIEKMEAGLRYKRVYEHEQNIITIQRRARADVDKASLIVAQKFNLEIEIDNESEENHIIRAIGFEGDNYDLGELNFGDARFEKIKDALQDGGSAIYQHKETKQEHVQDKNDHYTPRYVTRAIRYEDATAILANQQMPTKLNYNAPISGKEATDYGPGFDEGDDIEHNEKVVGQIRGYGRFLSATTSGQMATSTSRGSYDSPFGTVKIDLAKMPKTGYTEAHTEDAMDEIYGIPDLGQVEYIPKHLKGETANIKAGRDAYRAREIVVDSPPVNAVTTLPRREKEVGFAIIGISSSAKKENITAALGKWADKMTFIEVNANYKRDIGAHKGRSVFIFFKDVPDTEEIKKHLQAGRGQNKIDDDAHIVEIPSSEELSQHKNPKQIANQELLKAVTTASEKAAEALTEASAAKLSRKKITSIQKVKLQIIALQKSLDEKDDTETAEYKTLIKNALGTIKMQCKDIISSLTQSERQLPQLAKLLAYV